MGSVSCTSAGNCVGGASYTDSSGHSQAMTAVESNGTWGQPLKVSLPSDAASNQFASVDGVYCSSLGNCFVVGYYTDSSGGIVPMVASETGGTWGQATKLTAPGDAATNPNAKPENLSCPSAGNCVWVGLYNDSAGHRQAMQAIETGGAWGQTTKVSAPSDAASNPNGALWDVSCTSAGNCIEVGQYNDSSGRTQAMQSTETDGTWGQATMVGVPSPAAANPGAVLNSVSCTSAGNCVEVGQYNDNSGHTQAMQASETDGTWGPPVQVSAPSDAATNPGAVLNYVSCTSAGNCVGVGQYNDSSGHRQAMQASENHGAWGQLTKISAPSDAATNPSTSLVYVSCTPAGNCVAVGWYTDSLGHRQAMATVTLPDATAPTTTITLDPVSPNGSNSWYVSQVGGTVSASDPGDDSVAATRCVVDPTSVPTSFDDLPSGACSLNSVSSDGQHTIYAASEDSNSNKETPVSVSFQIDQTAPNDGPVLSGTQGDNGWYTSNVNVDWNWGDAGSQVDTSNCTQTSNSSDEGSAVTISSSCQDLAGNTATESITVKIDQTAPDVSCPSPAPVFLLGGTGTVTASVTDATSKPVQTSVSAAADTTMGGATTISLTGQDNAGNATTVSCPYTVAYGFVGFSSPLSKGTPLSGSTIPVKFVLTDSNGHPISSSTAAALAAAGQVDATLAGPGISPQSAVCAWNSTKQLFQCNIKTPSGVLTGTSHSYTITASEDLGDGFINAPAVGTASNPETVYFK